MIVRGLEIQVARKLAVTKREKSVNRLDRAGGAEKVTYARFRRGDGHAPFAEKPLHGYGLRSISDNGRGAMGFQVAYVVT